MRNTEFKTKEEYLQYRKDWKQEYKELSQDIKDRKFYNKEFNRAYNIIRKNVNPDSGWSKFIDQVLDLLKSNERYQILDKKYKPEKYWRIETFKEKASSMLLELKYSKIEANRQYLEQKKLINAII